MPEGAPLFKLDDRLARIKLEQAKTAVRLAHANVKIAEATREAAALRVLRLREVPHEVGLRRELDEAEMQFKSAESAIAAAGVPLISAPLAGWGGFNSNSNNGCRVESKSTSRVSLNIV